jgi:hypothetical protein
MSLASRLAQRNYTKQIEIIAARGILAPGEVVEAYAGLFRRTQLVFLAGFFARFLQRHYLFVVTDRRAHLVEIPTMMVHGGGFYKHTTAARPCDLRLQAPPKAEHQLGNKVILPTELAEFVGRPFAFAVFGLEAQKAFDLARTPPVAFKFSCPSCGQRIATDCSFVGAEGKCPTCGVGFAVPSPDGGSTREQQATSEVTAASQANVSPLRGVWRIAGAGIAVIALLVGAKFYFDRDGEVEREAVQPDVVQSVMTQPGASNKVSAPATDRPAESNFKDFAGSWQGRMPRSVTNEPYDMALTVTFDENGNGSPRLTPPGGGVMFITGAVSANLVKQDGKDRVRFLTHWDAALSPEKTRMTWTQVKGSTIVEFTKLAQVEPAEGGQ